MTLSTWLKGPTQRQSWFGALTDGLNAVGSVLIFAIMALICADVLARNFFNHPISGVAELVSASIVMIVFFQLASALRHGRMAQADIFIAGFSRQFPRLGHALKTIFYLLGAAMLAIIFDGTLPVFLNAVDRQLFMGVEGVFTFPIWPIRLVVLFCAAVTVLQYILLAVREIGRIFQPVTHTEENAE
ncbi:TRAP transporter small permease subunit [Saccharospirillum sp. MSK14-1]|uniref:TRAP transporter small permease subunit n=1 Tax=Saccharospirillum sp. MSK14-1 TaxID=1897632 RepID=UPI001E2C3560|nr:TRAP transporter small permease [Saccharospirillum sp. MSK14-1]